MIKPALCILFFVLFLSIVSAKTDIKTERMELEEGQSMELSGRRLTLINLDYENQRVIVCVNGKRSILSEGSTKNINEAAVDLRKVTQNKADIRMSVYCPGCECDERCDNSVCFNKCYSDKDCDDGNDLTEDKCSGTPKTCHNIRVKECTVDEHCDDNNDCTIDKCSSILSKCSHTKKVECDSIEKVTSDTTKNIVEKIPPQDVKVVSMMLIGVIFILIVALIFKKSLS